jgi:hypothetical protein
LQNNLWVSAGAGNPRQISSAGIITTPFGTDVSMLTEAFDAQGNLYGRNAPSPNSSYVIKLVPGFASYFTTFAGGGGNPYSGAPPNAISMKPQAIAFDRFGNLLIADGYYRVYSVSPSGLVATIAGTGAFNESGDGGLAINASLSPSCIATDGMGNIYVCTYGRIRKITPSGVINTVATFITNNVGSVTTYTINFAKTDAAGHLYAGSPSLGIFRLDALPPAVTSLLPASATPGGPAFTLTVTGQGFDVDSVVQWNGSARTTIYVSATQLSAQIFAADIASAGTANITVFNPGLGGATSSTATFEHGAPLFNAASIVNGASFQTGVAPGSIVSIFGSSLSATTAAAPSLPLPTTLGGASVTLNGTPVPLLYASPTQIKRSQ